MAVPSQFPAIEPPIPELHASSAFDAVIQYPLLKALIPVPVILLIAPVIWLIFRSTWKAIDDEARLAAQSRTETDYRPLVCLVLLAMTLTLQDYYGGRSFFQSTIEPALGSWEAGGATWLKLSTYRELYTQIWWAAARILGYVVAPLVVWRALFPQDSVLDMGLRTRGFLSHLWIYGLALTVVLGAMLILSKQRDFLEYYPFYKGASRSWFDLLAWEAAYFAQFLALEFYFRGWMLQSLRATMGSSAIFVMAVPYCMIHFGKPYLEAHGAIVAGVVLGSLAMRTRSIYAGFLVHVTVAGLMDYFALASRGGIPTRMFP